MANATAIEVAEVEAVLAVADHPAFVFGAYFAAFGPLTIIYALDLISEKWKTVKETRRAGYFILVLSFPSLIFLFIYIHMQKRAQDYKEMAAATSAAIYSVLHLMRTIWGIMQLNEFHKWNRNALLRMKCLGYDVLGANVSGKLKRRKCRKNCDAGETLAKRTRTDTDSSTDFSSDDASSSSGSDSEDTPSSGDGKMTCFTPVYKFVLERTKKMRKIISKMGSNLGELKQRLKSHVDHVSESDTICEVCKNIEKVEVTVNDEMVVNSSLIDNEFMHAELPCQLDLVGLGKAIWRARSTVWRDPWSISVSDFMKCKLPEECTVKWIVAFLSRFGSSWLTDSRNDESGNDLAVLAALAVTHQVRVIEEDGQEELEHESVLSPGHAFSVDRREIQSSSLKMSLDIQNSLPYKMRSDRDVKRIDFAAYESNIRDSIANWDTASVNKLEKNAREAVTRIKPYQVAMFAKLIAGTGENRISMEDIRVAVPEYSFRTFNDQLAADTGKNNAFSAFPFRREFTNVLLWRGKFQNRFVLQASLHADNWLSLESGYRQKSMLANSSLEARTRLCTEDVFTFQKNIEKKRLQNDLATSKEISDILPIHKAKFLGCGIESVRSFLAKWFSNNTHLEQDPTMWKPYVSYERHEFRCSSQLAHEISKFSSEEHPANPFNTQRNIDMRILWEIQWALHGFVSGTLNTSGLIFLTRCPQIIMLFILSFPSLSVQKLPQAMESVQMDPESEVLIREISSYLITPVEGPQPLSIKFSFNMETREGVTEIVSDHPETNPIQFDWQSWKDAALARLSAQSEWREERLYSTTENLRKDNLRKKLDTKSVSFLRKKDLETDFDLAYWNGWPPHCCQIAHFEIKESEELRKFERYDKIYENGEYAVKRLIYAMDSMREDAGEKESGDSLYASAQTCFNKGRKNQWLEFLIRCISDYGHSEALDDAVTYLYSGGSLECTQLLESLKKGVGATLRIRKQGNKLRYKLLDFYKVAEYADQIYTVEPEKSKSSAHFIKGLAFFYAKDFEKGIDERCIEAFESGLFHNPDCSFYLGLSYYRMFHRNGHLEHKQMASNFIRSYKSSGIRLKTSFGYLLEKGSFTGRNCKRLLSLCAYVQRWEDSDIICDLFRFLFLPSKTSGLSIVHSDDDEARLSGIDSDEIQLANGLYKDINRAAKLYRSAIRMHKSRTGAEYIEEQNPHNSGGDASNRLAMMYHSGPDIDSQINKDSFGYLSHKSPLLKAEKIYLEAIEMGNTDALCNIGILHADRLDEARNEVRAVEYFERAVRAGHTCAMNNLAFMYEHGTGCTRNVEEARNLYEKSFRRARNPVASFNLGILLKFGDAKERNVKRADKLFRGILNRDDLSHMPVLLSQVKVALNESLSEHDVETSFTSITEEFEESFVYLKLVYKI